MSKVTQKCPICNGKFIVLMVNEVAQIAWPECWKCGFSGHCPEDTESMHIDLKLNSHMDDTQLIKEAVETWDEYLALLEEQNTPRKVN